jgi:hypothetical protein
MVTKFDLPLVSVAKEPNFDFKKHLLTPGMKGLHAFSHHGEWKIWRAHYRACHKEFPYAGTFRCDDRRVHKVRGMNQREMLIVASLWWDALLEVEL